MPPRSPGRPKAANPKDVRVTVRLTEQEADHLCRLAGTDSLSQAMRAALRDYLNRRGGVRMLPDSERAMVRRELRKAKRAGQAEDVTLHGAFALDEPSCPAEDPPTPFGTFERHTTEAREMPYPPLERRTIGVEATTDC